MQQSSSTQSKGKSPSDNKSSNVTKLQSKTKTPEKETSKIASALLSSDESLNAFHDTQEEHERSAFDEVQVWMYLLLWFSVYSVYHLTLLPSVPGGDSGELLGNACIMGVSHPPGYPLFSLLTYAAGNFPMILPRVFLDTSGIRFDWFPTFAWKVNNMCALLASCTVVLVALSSNELSLALGIEPGGPVLLVGALLLAFSPLTWEYSAQGAEVFALNNFICACVVFFTCRVIVTSQMKFDKFENDRSNTVLRYIFLGAFFSGMSFANQHASVLFLAILIPVVLVFSLPLLHSRKTVLICGSFGSFIFGCSPIAVQIYFARAFPARGSWGDLGTYKGVITHLLRSEYGTFKMGADRAGIEGAVERLRLYITHCSDETGHFVFPLLVVLLIGICKQIVQRVNFKPVMSPTAVVPTTSASPSVSKGSNKHGAATNNAIFTEDTSTKVLNALQNTDPAVMHVGIPTRASSSAGSGIALFGVLFGTWLFYVLVWHGILSNLPLSAPMPYMVHARFWIQPHIILCLLAGTGAAQFFSFLNRLVSLQKTFNNVIQKGVVICLFSAMLRYRFSLMDRSKSGWIMHKYGEAILESLPQNSLLLSHTDLDWNPTRYLRECEGSRLNTYAKNRPDVTHVNFQMIAYPWFASKQAPLYPHTVFPRVDFRGISTDRQTEGNAQLVTNMLVGNGASTFNPASIMDSDAHSFNSYRNRAGHAFTGGIYLDMQSINDVELEEGGKWRGLTLIPWGLVYRVFGPMSLRETETLQIASVERFRLLKKKLSPFAYESDSHKDREGKSILLYRQYPPGSWEFAALSVYNDARMQLGLNLLTYAIEVQKKADLNLLPILVDRLYTSADLLLASHEVANLYGTLSSSPADLHKNAAMAWMRMQGVVGIALSFKDPLTNVLRSQPELLDTLLPQNADLMNTIITQESYMRILRQAKSVISDFLRAYPEDKDRKAFEDAIQKIVEEQVKLSGSDIPSAPANTQAKKGKPNKKSVKE